MVTSTPNEERYRVVPNMCGLDAALCGMIYSTSFTTWHNSLPPLLDAAGLTERLPLKQTIMIKPNLLGNLRPPLTTPVALIGVLVDYLREKISNPIIIAEGCGDIDCSTMTLFYELGYNRMAAQKGVQLIDLNDEPCRKRTHPSYDRWPELFLPEISDDCFLISVPVLKAHTLADVTLTMKNMMGLVPPDHYRSGDSWKKSAFHSDLHHAIADLNRYRTPDFTILDATIGMAESHIGGRTCEPVVNMLAAGYDPVAMDSYGARLLKKDWHTIGHIAEVHNELGVAEPLREIRVSC